MATNVTYESNSKAAGWIQKDTEVETEQQGDGSHRQVVKIVNLRTSYPVTDNGGSLTVDATSLPLPTGAATAGAQTHGTQVAKILFDPSNMSAFGTLETAEPTPVIQGDFVYGLNTQIWQTAVVSGTGATVDTTSGRLRIQSGTANNGYAYIQTRRPVRYRAGQGQIARFTPLFTAGGADNIQIWGMGSIVTNAPYDGYFFSASASRRPAFARSTTTTSSAWSCSSAWRSIICTGGESCVTCCLAC